MWFTKGYQPLCSYFDMCLHSACYESGWSLVQSPGDFVCSENGLEDVPLVVEHWEIGCRAWKLNRHTGQFCSIETKVPNR